MLRGSLTFFKQLKSCPSEYQQEFYSKWFTGLKNANGDRIIDRVPTGRKERKSRTDGRSVKQTNRQTDGRTGVRAEQTARKRLQSSNQQAENNGNLSDSWTSFHSALCFEMSCKHPRMRTKKLYLHKVWNAEYPIQIVFSLTNRQLTLFW